MSRTRIEKENIKYGKGLIDKPSEKLKRKWNRFNKELGYERNERNLKRLKEIEKYEMD